MIHKPESQLDLIEARFGRVNVRSVNPNFHEYPFHGLQLSSGDSELNLITGQSVEIYVPRTIGPKGFLDVQHNNTRLEFIRPNIGVRRVFCRGPLGSMALSVLGADLPHIQIEDEQTDGHATMLFEKILRSITTNGEREAARNTRVKNFSRPLLAPLP